MAAAVFTAILKFFTWAWRWRGIGLALVVFGASCYGYRLTGSGWLFSIGLVVAVVAGAFNTLRAVGVLQQGPPLDDKTVAVTLVFGVLGLIGAYIAYLGLVNDTRDAIIRATESAMVAAETQAWSDFDREKEKASNSWSDWIAMTFGMIVVFVGVLFLLTWMEHNKANEPYRHLLRILWLGALLLFTVNLFSIPPDVSRVLNAFANLPSPGTS